MQHTKQRFFEEFLQIAILARCNAVFDMQINLFKKGVFNRFCRNRPKTLDK